MFSWSCASLREWTLPSLLPWDTTVTAPGEPVVTEMNQLSALWSPFSTLCHIAARPHTYTTNHAPGNDDEIGASTCSSNQLASFPGHAWPGKEDKLHHSLSYRHASTCTRTQVSSFMAIVVLHAPSQCCYLWSKPTSYITTLPACYTCCMVPK